LFDSQDPIADLGALRRQTSDTWSEEAWEAQVTEIFKEYTLDEHYSQSPLDNSTDEASEIISEIEHLWKIEEQSYSDAFIDKMIGGLRGDNKYQLARFLKFLDNYIVAKGILPPTSLELSAIKC